MNRWTVVALLLLVPLTLAPRTSVNNEIWLLDVVTPRATTAVGAPMPVTVTLTNNTEEPMRLLPVTFVATVDGASGAAVIDTISRGCEADGDMAGCWVPSLEPDESATYRLLVRGTSPGLLELALNVRGGDGLAPAAWTVSE